MKPIRFAIALLAFGLLNNVAGHAQMCPESYNPVVQCSSKGCFGQTDRGYCGGPDNASENCVIEYTTCCGTQYPFAENEGPCTMDSTTACGPARGDAVGRLVILASADGRHPRFAIFGSSHTSTSTASARTSKSLAAF